MDCFASIASPVTTLTQKSKMFEWSEACEKSFKLLKHRLTSALILTLPERTKDIVVKCDASHVGLGGVFMEFSKLIVYASRQQKIHERNYPTHDLQLAAAVFGLKIWRHYMNRVHFYVFMDHKSLQYVFTQKELNFLQIRWLELLKDYDMSVLYQLGKANVVVYALSWKTMCSIYHHDES